MSPNNGAHTNDSGSGDGHPHPDVDPQSQPGPARQPAELPNVLPAGFTPEQVAFLLAAMKGNGTFPGFPAADADAPPCLFPFMPSWQDAESRAGTFVEQEDAKITRLVSQLLNLLVKEDHFNRTFFEKLLVLKSQLDPLLELPEGIYYYFMKHSMSFNVKKILQDKMDATITADEAKRPDCNFASLCQDLSALLEQLKDTPKQKTTTANQVSAEGSHFLERSTKQSTPSNSKGFPKQNVTCPVCTRKHCLEDCWVIHPEKAPIQWRPKYLELNAQYKAGTYTPHSKSKPANPISSVDPTFQTTKANVTLANMVSTHPPSTAPVRSSI
ncbi:hypothetical protein KEM56_004341 [Ascosphaera pollenicola]|nr:hypothetical protein KEM56_004341 [Ascosphaera pollenicola]